MRRCDDVREITSLRSDLTFEKNPSYSAVLTPIDLKFCTVVGNDITYQLARSFSSFACRSTVPDKCKADDGKSRHTKLCRLLGVVSLCSVTPLDTTHGHLRSIHEANQAQRCRVHMGQTVQFWKPKRGKRTRTARAALRAAAICWCILRAIPYMIVSNRA